MRIKQFLICAIVAACAVAAMAMPATALAATECDTYRPGTHDSPYGGTYTVPDKFDGRAYRGCIAPASDFPKYKGWSGYSFAYAPSCATLSDPRPEPQPLAVCMMYVPPSKAWKWTNGDFTEVNAPGGTGYLHPYGSHAGWRWFYQDGDWYAAPTEQFRIVWYHTNF